MLRSSMAGCRSNPQMVLDDFVNKGNNFGGWAIMVCNYNGFILKRNVTQNYNPTFSNHAN